MVTLVDGNLYQWDTGRVVLVNPSSEYTVHEVHFTNRKLDFAYVAKTYTKGENTYCSIPNVLLQQYFDVYCYEVRENSSGEESISTTTFKVIKRNRPLDYIYTESEEYTYLKLEKRVETLEDTLEEVKTSSNEASALANEAYNIAETVQTTASGLDARIDELEQNITDSIVSDYDLLENKPITNVKSDRENMIALRDLSSGVYRLSGSFTPYTGSNLYISFQQNQLVNVVTKSAGTHIQVYYPVDNTIQFVSIMVDDTSPTGYTFERINVKLNDLQTKPKAITVSLPASGWTGNDMVYSQVVSVPGVTANSQVDLRPSPEQLKELLTSEISLTAANDAGEVTVFAIGGTPSSDYSIQIIVSEVDVV